MTATRLDVALVARGLAESREKAQALVMAGRVRVDGTRADKPGRAVKDDAGIDVAPGPEHVGRGALKLEGALDRFGLDPAGRVAIDVGASTGGFTEVLLARGAVRVYALDVGRGQLHEKIRADPRVVVLEKTNARDLSPAIVPEPCAIASVDVSFISVRKILAPLATVLADGADAVVLVKPQFEVGRRQVSRGGLVTDPALHLSSLADVAAEAQTAGYGVVGAGPSPITGTEGNREFFLHLVARGRSLERGGFDVMMEAAVRP